LPLLLLLHHPLLALALLHLQMPHALPHQPPAAAAADQRRHLLLLLLLAG
jgi:hypothetical protein